MPVARPRARRPSNCWTGGESPARSPVEKAPSDEWLRISSADPKQALRIFALPPEIVPSNLRPTHDVTSRERAGGSVRRRHRSGEWKTILALIFLIPAVIAPVIALAGAEPTLAVSRAPQAGAEMRLSGSGFGDGARVVLLWDGSRVDWLPRVNADGEGAFRLTVAIPARIAGGMHTITGQERR